ncbi:YoaK family protein [Asticcacaulis taihuensis]|uniref:YoaK family protein n=1 Tax=Asticcacaulis taihuensis TaxID=260084 RepID=UPI0026ED1CF6|nr:YoaK family protein [Asticcacaulis taihuensis]
MNTVPSLLGKRPERTLPVAALLIAAAGMLDAFTYAGYGGVFANAMTGNIVLMVVRMAEGEGRLVLPFAAPIAAYICGVAVAQVLKEKPLGGLLPSQARFSLGLEIVFLIVVAFLPKSVPDMLVVTGIAFVAALQASAFYRLGEFAYTSVTTSANLRHFASATIAWLIYGEGRERRRESLFFLCLCICFIGGALLGAVATLTWGHAAVWLPVGLLSVAFALCLPWTKGNREMLGEDK